MARFLKGSKEAKKYMASIRKAKGGTTIKKISGATKCKHKICGSCGGVKKIKKIGTLLNDVCSAKCLASQKDICECKCGGEYHKNTNSNKLTKILSKKVPTKKAVIKQGTLFGIGNMFDYSVINDIDSLKKEYFKLAKKYHPDAGGSTIQFQNLQKEYDIAFKKLLSGSKLSSDEKQNEIIVDEAIKEIINQIISLEGINIELVGKWLWISGNTYPVRTTLKAAGLIFIKKNNVPYWIYKGSESKGRGKMDIEEIRQKYGTAKFDIKPPKKISGLNSINKIKLKRALSKLKTALNKRSV